MHSPDDTIAAISTPPGRGAIGIVRLSGPDALSHALSVFQMRSNDLDVSPARAYLGRFIDAADHGKVLDTGYMTYHPAGRSYTGDDVVELSCHGSPVILEAILGRLLAAGSVAALAGEFTYRAVLNGRLDLAQAEGVRDLIAASTREAASVAQSQLRGDLSREVARMLDTLVETISRAEAALEFAEEPDVAAANHDLVRGVSGLMTEMEAFLSSYRRGRMLREGARVVLAGRPNAGKSSLFNRLLRHERAIVSPEPGTTRDFISERIDLDGIPVTLIDTAGLRDNAAGVEGEGVDRARRLTGDSDLVLLLCPCDDAPDDADRALLEGGGGRVLLVASKSDLGRATGPGWVSHGPAPLEVSAGTGAGLDHLHAAIAAALSGGDRSPAGRAIITDARHHEALRRCASGLDRARRAVEAGQSEEVVLVDLYAALEHLGEITGMVTRDAIYDRIFSTFCIGK